VPASFTFIKKVGRKSADQREKRKALSISISRGERTASFPSGKRGKPGKKPKGKRKKEDEQMHLFLSYPGKDTAIPYLSTRKYLKGPEKKEEGDMTITLPLKRDVPYHLLHPAYPRKKEKKKIVSEKKLSEREGKKKKRDAGYEKRRNFSLLLSVTRQKDLLRGERKRRRRIKSSSSSLITRRGEKEVNLGGRPEITRE